jgi:hypothetical protein
MSDLWVRANAIRYLARVHELTWAETVERFGERLTGPQCNMVTDESVRACERAS